MSNTAIFRSHKIVISFEDSDEALGWFDQARALGAIPDSTDLYRADALDMGRDTDNRTYLVRRDGDRPARFKLRAPSSEDH